MKLYPSGLNQLKHCTGFLQAGAGLPRIPKCDAATEGDTAHAMLADMLVGKEVSTENTEMLIDIMNVRDYILSVRGAAPLYVEQKVDLSYLNPGTRGTADIVWFEETYRNLVILDLKYGMIEVQAQDNWQLIAYASYFMQKYNPSVVTLIIAQPKVDDPYKVATYTPDQLNAELSRMKEAIRIAHSTEARCTPGMHCRYCNNLWACAPASDYILRGMEAIYLPCVEDMTRLAAKLSLFREVSKLSKKKVDQLEAIISSKLRNGERVTDIQMTQKKGRMKFILDDELLKHILPANCCKSVLLTPKQIIDQKLVEKTVIESMVKRGYSYSLDVLTQEDYKKCLKT
jgi:hypothetical protein